MALNAAQTHRSDDRAVALRLEGVSTAAGQREVCLNASVFPLLLSPSLHHPSHGPAPGSFLLKAVSGGLLEDQAPDLCHTVCINKAVLGACVRQETVVTDWPWGGGGWFRTPVIKQFK